MLKKSFQHRTLYMFIASVLVFIIFSIAEKKDLDDQPFYKWITDFLITTITTVFIWKGNLFTYNFADQRWSWEKRPIKRAILQTLFNTVFTIGSIALTHTLYSHFVCVPMGMDTDFLIEIALIVGLLISFLINAIEVGVGFFNNWKKSLIEAEQLKEETLKIQLENLKNQVNPHFLFNSLSVLTSLVYKNQDKAVEFIHTLSDVYRYILDTQKQELVSVKTEIEFLNSFLYLLKVRFGDNLKTEINIASTHEHKLIPPLSLQILVENTIKHNIVSSDQPLTVSIFTEKNCIVVKNNIQLRQTHESSSKIGHENIKKRLSYFTEDAMVIDSNDGFYTVRIPLI